MFRLKYPQTRSNRLDMNWYVVVLLLYCCCWSWKVSWIDPTFHLYSPHTTWQNSMLYIALGVDSPFSFSFTLRLTWLWRYYHLYSPHTTRHDSWHILSWDWFSTPSHKCQYQLEIVDNPYMDTSRNFPSSFHPPISPPLATFQTIDLLCLCLLVHLILPGYTCITKCCQVCGCWSISWLPMSGVTKQI